MIPLVFVLAALVVLVSTDDLPAETTGSDT